MTVVTPAVCPEEDAPRQIPPGTSPVDRLFRGGATGTALLTLVLLVLIGAFLLVKAQPALSQTGWGFITERRWDTEAVHPRFGVAALVYGTVVIAAIALLIAVPTSILAALFLTDYAPRRLRGPLTSLVDLLSSVPSIVFGLWGVFAVQPQLVGVATWLSTHLSGVPVLRVGRQSYTGSAFVAGVVVSLMILPIITSVVREVFAQAPTGEKEAALALGSTRWAMIRTVVLPFGRGGVVAGTMLGLGRALGETVAVAVIISPTFEISPHVLQTGANSIAALIALRFGDANALGLSALMAAGVALFVMTLVVNLAASFVVARSRSGAGVDL